MPAVEMLGIDKHFGAVPALSGVDFAVEAGTIHGLVGENGAGKTTLMRILYGAIFADAGTVSLDGDPVRFADSAQAIKQGIGMVSQHYAIIPDLTNLQNLLLGAEPGWLIRQNEMRAKAGVLAQRMGFSFDWNASSAELSPSGAQKLEILKLLWRNARIMILDEPTAMLSPADGDALFASLKGLAEAGATVILVTHRLLEVVSHCQHVTVLREGRVVADQPVGKSSVGELAELIIGRAPATPEHEIPMGDGGVQLKLSQVSARGYRGDLALDGLNLEVRAGEVLGIAGVDGNGQRELFQILSGELAPETGDLIWDSKTITNTSVRERLQAGFRLIPENRVEEGLVEEWSLEENAALGAQRQTPFAKGPRIDVAGRREATEQIVSKLSTKHGGLGNAMSGLSGGNQQRFVAGRALYGNPKLVLAFQPSRGLDVEATSNFYRELHALCRSGSCAIVVSFDLDEVLENCDRVVVMRSGKAYQPAEGEDHDRQAIGRLMVGAR